MSKLPAEQTCGTIPEPQNLAMDRHQRQLSASDVNLRALSLDLDQSRSFDVPTAEELLNTPVSSHLSSLSGPGSPESSPSEDDWRTVTTSRSRKLCVRHLRMADEGTLTNLQRVRRPNKSAPCVFRFLHCL
jgi:hypothetical protein